MRLTPCSGNTSSPERFTAHSIRLGKVVFGARAHKGWTRGFQRNELNNAPRLWSYKMTHMCVASELTMVVCTALGVHSTLPLVLHCVSPHTRQLFTHRRAYNSQHHACVHVWVLLTYKGVLVQQKVGQVLNILFDTRKLVCLGDHIALQARHGVSNTTPRSTEYTGELDYSLTVLRMVSVAIKSVLSPLVYARSSVHVASQQEEEACETSGQQLITRVG